VQVRVLKVDQQRGTGAVEYEGDREVGIKF
jgi:hypothetical protein